MLRGELEQPEKYNGSGRLAGWQPALWLVALLLGCLPVYAAGLLSIESTIVRCDLADHASLVSYGPSVDSEGEDRSVVARRYSSWMMEANRKLERMPIVLYWIPKADGGPSMRVQTNSQDRKSAHLLSINEESVSSVVSLSDISITRSMLVTVNFKRETVSAARIESGAGGVRSDAFTFDCEFEPSATIEPGLLGDRFKYLDSKPDQTGN